MGPEFWLFAAVGFAAQLVDGALGMAYGVVSTTVLLANGVPPATASASVHAAKVFTGAASAVSHIAHRNVDGRLLALLAAGGMLGGVVGTYLLTSVDGELIKPFVVAWLGLMGVVILYRAWKGARPKPFSWKGPFPLGLVGGFFDAVGGGGWGPVVTSTLLGSGADPRKAIGTTNAADLMGWTDRIGTIEPGKWADIIAIDGDPVKDVKLLQHVPFVMKSGIVYKNETHKQ